MQVFYTFGTDRRYPYQGGWVAVEEPTVEATHRIFRAFYPDRVPGVLNCADYYTEEEFARTDMCAGGNIGRYCHKTLKLLEA